MSRRRWWENGKRSIQDEVAWFREDALDFELDEELLRDRDVVVFRGELALGDRRVAATVVYPPSYGFGDHPQVFAPYLPVERHRTPDGRLCLDHAVFGGTEPMCGAEAVARAQRLWDLWENDRDQLHEEEGGVADPRANYYDYQDGSALGLVDLDISGGATGHFQIRADQFKPLRGVITGLLATHPSPARHIPGVSTEVLGGPLDVDGSWVRIDAPPPFEVGDFGAWLMEEHRSMVERQMDHARQLAAANRRPDTPAVVGFVYPDEGPRQGETHDAWIFCAIDPPTGGFQIVRPYHLRSDERWLRQPQLEPLGGKSVTIVGAGALGSQVADLLAKAGVVRFTLVDHDVVTHGNRVRHQLDLTDVGRAKVHAVAERLLAVNPWGEVRRFVHRLGAVGGLGDEGAGQEADDAIAERMAESDLIVNTAVNSAAGAHVSVVGSEFDTPVIHGWVSAGAWGARVLIQRPGRSGCWDCFALAQAEPDAYADPVGIPEIPDDPVIEQIAERGCADPSFTGPGFDLTAASAAIARIAVQVLLEADGGYPAADFDLASLTFRDAASSHPSGIYTRLPVHPACGTCNPGS